MVVRTGRARVSIPTTAVPSQWNPVPSDQHSRSSKATGLAAARAAKRKQIAETAFILIDCVFRMEVRVILLWLYRSCRGWTWWCRMMLFNSIHQETFSRLYTSSDDKRSGHIFPINTSMEENKQDQQHWYELGLFLLRLRSGRSERLLYSRIQKATSDSTSHYVLFDTKTSKTKIVSLFTHIFRTCSQCSNEDLATAAANYHLRVDADCGGYVSNASNSRRFAGIHDYIPAHASSLHTHTVA